MSSDGKTKGETLLGQMQPPQVQSAYSATLPKKAFRNIIKAGYRRLHGLVLLQQKITNPRAKDKAAYRQVLVTQGPKRKEPAPPKARIDSTRSPSGSISGLSLQSDLPERVENIGQYWLEDLPPHWRQSPSTYRLRSLQEKHHYHTPYVLNLEGRNEYLERQNKILRTALLAALDLAAKPIPEMSLGGSISAPVMGKLVPSMTDASDSDVPSVRNERYNSSRFRPPYELETWIASFDSGQWSSCGSDDSDDHV